jgi:RNase P subunit RPR2
MNTEKSNQESTEQALTIPVVSGSTLLPDGWKVYECTDCQEINVKKDNRQITVGFCDNCEHPLWNDDVD